MIVILMPAKLFKVFEHHACTASAVKKEKPAFAREFKKVVPESLREYIDDGWTARKAISDLNRWMDTSKSKPQTSLSQLLQRYDELFCLFRFCSGERLSLYPYTVNGFLVYPLPVALLVEIATFLMPDNLTSSLVQSFHEVYELIIYTEARTMKPEHAPILLQSLKLGEVVSGGEVFHTYLRPIIKRNKSFEEGHPSQSPLNDALLILQHLESTCYKNESDEDSLEDGATCEDGLGDDVLFKHVREINRKINSKGPYETIEALRDFVEQMFCDFVRILLTNLPVALVKEVMESPPQELEESSKHALKMISKIESFEELIERNLSRDDTILSLMKADSEDEEEEDGSGEEDNV